jgi:glutamine---fructose-6-phosphate transaminase (isomerizing)
MCGIFGIIVKPNTSFPANSIEGSLRKIAQISESRGKDSSGIAFRIEEDHTIQVIKGDVAIRKLLDGKEFSQCMHESLESYKKQNGFFAFGHARLVTNGSQLQEVNNQPVIKDGIITIHNGIVVNVDELWKKHATLTRNYLIDTEIIPALMRKESRNHEDLVLSCNSVLNQLEGTYSIACMFEDLDQIVLATNNGSLYYITDNKIFMVFASEEHFLKKIKKQPSFRAFESDQGIKQLLPNTGIVINLNNMGIHSFKITTPSAGSLTQARSNKPYKTNKHLIDNAASRKEVVIEPLSLKNKEEDYLNSLLEYNQDSITKLRRCTKCVLPETFPFIEFYEDGVCNYCKNHRKKNKEKSLLELKELVGPYRSKNSKPDCIVPFSGGRDSTYTLHFAKKELGLNPIAFTYDWGMVTDLARRNIARVCGKLGVENIIVSADIRWKRKNIQKNIKAWLKRPDLGMIPLFMAGDKYFFYYTDKIKRQTGIKLNIWGINHLENTDFKVGFCGIKPNFNKKTIYSLSMLSQLNLFKHIGKNILLNHSYINESVFDTLGSFASRYISPKKDYYHFFDYYPWNEKEIEELILKEYNWETAIDTHTTWRIGDGTAGFYNYLYYTVAGFSEYDTFRSNQIREEMITREEALKKVNEENKPRFTSIMWYLKIVGLDFKEVINRINNIDKLYKMF